MREVGLPGPNTRLLPRLGASVPSRPVPSHHPYLAAALALCLRTPPTCMSIVALVAIAACASVWIWCLDWWTRDVSDVVMAAPAEAFHTMACTTCRETGLKGGRVRGAGTLRG